MSFPDKLDKVLRVSKLVSNINQLEKEIGVSTGTILKPYNKGKPPGLGTVKKIIEYLGINQEWWDTGKGEMYLPQSEKKDKLRDVDIIEAENYIGMHRRVYDAIEKSLHYFQEIATQAQKNANDLTQILGRRSGPGNDSPQV